MVKGKNLYSSIFILCCYGYQTGDNSELQTIILWSMMVLLSNVSHVKYMLCIFIAHLQTVITKLWHTLHIWVIIRNWHVLIVRKLENKVVLKEHFNVAQWSRTIMDHKIIVCNSEWSPVTRYVLQWKSIACNNIIHPCYLRVSWKCVNYQ
jgi:hypothetical protein